MTFTHTITGATDRSSIIRGDVAYVSGTWRAQSVTSGTISPGGSTVLGFQVTVGSAAFSIGTADPHSGSALVLSKANETGNGDARPGQIRVSAIDNSGTEVAGDWHAEIRV